MITRPTPRQLAILSFIDGQTYVRGYAPTHREIGAEFGIRSTNGVNDHLLALERKGLLMRDPLKSRAMRLTEAGLALLGHDPKAKGPRYVSTAPRVNVRFGMRCGRCNAHTFDLDKPCAICRLERRRVA